MFNCTSNFFFRGQGFIYYDNIIRLFTFHECEITIAAIYIVSRFSSLMTLVMLKIKLLLAENFPLAVVFSL